MMMLIVMNVKEIMLMKAAIMNAMEMIMLVVKIMFVRMMTVKTK